MSKKRAPNYKIDPALLGTLREWQFQSGHVVTVARQQRALYALIQRTTFGCTALELACRVDPGDETAIVRWAPPFSLLHKAGIIEALAEKRDGYAVYVLPEHVEGRETTPHYNHHCKGCRCYDKVAA